MAVSVYPAPQAGGASGFLVDMGDATQTTTVLDSLYPAGGYDISLAIPDASFDIYGLNASGVYVGYSNSASIVFTEPVKTVVIYGSVPNQIYTFGFSGSSASPTSSGSASGAGAYITSAEPTDLPNNDDFTVITGGNFDSDLRVWFIGTDESVTEAKQVTVTSPTEATVVRPDDLLNTFAPYTLKVKNDDTPEPVGTNVHILPDAITKGVSPTWVTTNFVTPFYEPNQPYSAFLEATDPDSSLTYTIVDGLLPQGLTLNPSTGEISGTTALTDTRVLTFRATDAGGNFTDRTLTMSYLGSFVSSNPPAAKQQASYSFQFVAEISDEINFSDVGVSAEGFTFDGEVNPTLTVIRGEKYQWGLNVLGHPIYIQTQPAPYNTVFGYSVGVVGAGSQVGTLNWTVDSGAPSTLYYVSSIDPTFTGTINVVNQPSPAIGNATYSVVSGSLPGGMTLSSAGVLSGTPTGFGVSNFTVRAAFNQQGYVDKLVEFEVKELLLTNIDVSSNFVAPQTGDYVAILVGGGGCGMLNDPQSSRNGSGGAGGSVVVRPVTLSAGSSYSIVIGAGGAGGNMNSPGQNGGSTEAFSFTANGGNRGTETTAGGGSSTSDTVNNFSGSFTTFGQAASGAGGNATDDAAGPGYLIMGTRYGAGGGQWRNPSRANGLGHGNPGSGGRGWINSFFSGITPFPGLAGRVVVYTHAL